MQLLNNRFPAHRAVTDFRFPLMRHWSVYESIIHSRYVAVRLGTWQEKGRDKVDELLVKMGLSQRDCKQDYCAPSLSLRSPHKNPPSAWPAPAWKCMLETPTL